MSFSRLSVLAMIILLMSPTDVYSHCEYAGDHPPQCSGEVFGGVSQLMLSMTNKVTSIRFPEQSFSIRKQCSLDNLPCANKTDCSGALNLCLPIPDQQIDSVVLANLATGIYHTVGIIPVCTNGSTVAISLDAVTPEEKVKQDLIQKILEAARAGPSRIKFWIAQGRCIRVLDQFYPVATSVRIIQEKEE